MSLGIEGSLSQQAQTWSTERWYRLLQLEGEGNTLCYREGRGTLHDRGTLFKTQGESQKAQVASYYVSPQQTQQQLQQQSLVNERNRFPGRIRLADSSASDPKYCLKIQYNRCKARKRFSYRFAHFRSPQ